MIADCAFCMYFCVSAHLKTRSPDECKPFFVNACCTVKQYLKCTPEKYNTTIALYYYHSLDTKEMLNHLGILLF